MGSRASMLSAILLLGCSGTSTSSNIEVSGPKYDEKHYDGQPPLGEPPALDPATPGAAFLQEAASLLQPPWRSFLEDCRLRLPPNHELNRVNLQIVLEIVARPTGEILTIKTLRSSDNEDFDEVALEIVKDLQRLPEAPPELLSDDERVHLRWSFAHDSRQAGPATAEVTRVELPIEHAVPRLLASGQYEAVALRLIKEAGETELALPLVTELATTIVGEAMVATDPELSTLALHAVAKAGLQSLVGNARNALRSSDVHVAAAAAEALGKIGKEADVDLLLALAAGGEGTKPTLSAAAGAALIALGKNAELVALTGRNLASEEPAQRTAAMAVLTILPHPQSVPALARLLADPKSSRADRAAAAAALGRQAATEVAALKALLAGTSAKDASLRVACVRAIGKAADLGLRSRLAYWRMIELTKDKDERVRAGAIMAASLLDASRFAGELKSLRAGGSEQVLLGFARALKHVPGPLSLARLLDLTAVDDQEMRLAATASLLAHDDDKARQRLAELLADDSADVRLAALPSLTGGPELERFLDDASEEVRAAAMQALAMERGRKATARLFAEKLADAATPSMQLRLAAAWLHGK